MHAATVVHNLQLWHNYNYCVQLQRKNTCHASCLGKDFIMIFFIFIFFSEALSLIYYVEHFATFFHTFC